MAMVTLMDPEIPSAGIRETNRINTRRDVAAAAVELFDRQGVEETTVDEIAELAGVSRRTLFRHFPTKADMIFADHDERLARVEAFLALVDRDRPALDVLPELAVEVVSTLTDPAEFYLARNRVLRRSTELRGREQSYGLRYAKPVSQFLVDRLDGHPDRELLAEIIAISMVTVVNRAQRSWAASGGTVDAAALTGDGTDLLVRIFEPVIHGDQPSGGPGDDSPSEARAEIVRLMQELLAG